MYNIYHISHIYAYKMYLYTYLGNKHKFYYTYIYIYTVFIRFKVGLIYMQGLKYTPGSAVG